jgi:hypothetical protein
MSLDPALSRRLAFLVRVVRKEARHLSTTDTRLFAAPFTSERAASIADDADLAERVEAFVGRFGRLQDTLGDKLLPHMLLAMGETPGAAIDNLDRAERLGLIESADDWLVLRKLRNPMVHECIEDPVVLADSLRTGHAHVATLIAAKEAMVRDVVRRGWAADEA